MIEFLVIFNFVLELNHTKSLKIILNYFTIVNRNSFQKMAIFSATGSCIPRLPTMSLSRLIASGFKEPLAGKSL
jgi:hypothetical protein